MGHRRSGVPGRLFAVQPFILASSRPTCASAWTPPGGLLTFPSSPLCASLLCILFQDLALSFRVRAELHVAANRHRCAARSGLPRGPSQTPGPGQAPVWGFASIILGRTTGSQALLSIVPSARAPAPTLPLPLGHAALFPESRTTCPHRARGKGSWRLQCGDKHPCPCWAERGP